MHSLPTSVVEAVACADAECKGLDPTARIWSPAQIPCHQFLDPYNDSEETPGCSAYSPPYRSLGDVTCDRLHMLKSKRPVHLQDLVVKAAGGAPVSPEACDVDMQPAEASSPKARALAARLSGSLEDSKMMEEPLETGRHTQGRARASRLAPRLWNERDKGPKLRLSKRKLELVLTEPEKNKRKRQLAA